MESNQRLFKNKHLLLFFSVFILLFSQYGCNKDDILDRSDAELIFSTDTLTFDTVFTTLGSTTRSFKIYNQYNQTARIKEIRLSGGENSQFRINVDGISGTEFKDYEILPGDSMYVFVEVTVDPSDASLPFVMTDSISFLLGNNPQKVTLAAWGQNANFYYGQTICDEIWDDDKPYVIVNSLLVDSACFLRIEEGVQVHLSNNSRLFVNGTLELNGQIDNPVILQQLRLEQFYRELPGQWEGIHILRPSVNNVFSNALIKNAVVGVRVDSLPENNNPKVSFFNTEIRNTLSSGILGITTVLYGENILIYNCGEHNIQMEYGGIYDFRHATLANYSSSFINHNKPIIRASNFLATPDALSLAPIYATFTNSIIYGSLDEEIFIEEAEPGVVDVEILFNHALVKTEMPEDTVFFNNVLRNMDPQFTDRFEKDYTLLNGSPAIDAGTQDAGVQNDFKGNMRSGQPDLGAFEFQ
ncbi:MAG: hypothetical protein EA412_13140 [Chitinophagaceae bacterium]|nr:MAG: hypothetical protein EA412_13140 [Chitinophagaceae bacterium]